MACSCGVGGTASGAADVVVERLISVRVGCAVGLGVGHVPGGGPYLSPSWCEGVFCDSEVAVGRFPVPITPVWLPPSPDSRPIRSARRDCCLIRCAAWLMRWAGTGNGGSDRGAGVYSRFRACWPASCNRRTPCPTVLVRHQCGSSAPSSVFADGLGEAGSGAAGVGLAGWDSLDLGADGVPVGADHATASCIGAAGCVEGSGGGGEQGTVAELTDGSGQAHHGRLLAALLGVPGCPAHPAP